MIIDYGKIKKAIKGKTATKVEYKDGILTVYYHSAAVITVCKGFVTMRTGGWFTNTTKNRINQVLSLLDVEYGIYQERGLWYVSDRRNRDAFMFTSNIFTIKIAKEN